MSKKGIYTFTVTLECKAEVSPSEDFPSMCRNSLGSVEFIGYGTTINEAKVQEQKKAIAYLERMTVIESTDDPMHRFKRRKIQVPY